MCGEWLSDDASTTLPRTTLSIETMGPSRFRSYRAHAPMTRPSGTSGQVRPPPRNGSSPPGCSCGHMAKSPAGAGKCCRCATGETDRAGGWLADRCTAWAMRVAKGPGAPPLSIIGGSTWHTGVGELVISTSGARLPGRPWDIGGKGPEQRRLPCAEAEHRRTTCVGQSQQQRSIPSYRSPLSLVDHISLSCTWRPVRVHRHNEHRANKDPHFGSRPNPGQAGSKSATNPGPSQAGVGRSKSPKIRRSRGQTASFEIRVGPNSTNHATTLTKPGLNLAVFCPTRVDFWRC